MQTLSKLVQWCRVNDVKTFNVRLRWAAVLWLAISIAVGFIWWPTPPDFPQFYMGGLMARLSEWESLYPIPWSDVENPGIYSDPKPGDLALRESYYVPNYTRFMLPPPAALLFVPLSLLPYRWAGWVWVAVLTACTWGVAYYAGWLYRAFSGKPSPWEGVLTLLVVVSPMVCRAIRVQNSTPVIALMFAFTMADLLRSDRGRAGAAILLGALLKYATLALLPLLVAMRRWRALGGLALFGLATSAISLAVMGTEPFETFVRDIAPTLDRPSAYLGNQSLTGLLVRLHGPGAPLPRSVTLPLAAAQLLALAATLALIFRRRWEDWREPRYIFAAAAALLTWLLIFSPIAWEHYPIFLCPLWGWLVWEAQQSMRHRAIVITAMALMNFPQGIFEVEGFLQYDIALPEPWNSGQLWGIMMTAGVAMWRLSATSTGGARCSRSTRAGLIER
jgi:Glycosyltransferase family 87